MDNYILQLQTPKSKILSFDGLMPKFRKELIKVGNYIKDSTSQSFTVAQDTLNHWVKTFDLWLANGNKVSIPNSHNEAGNAVENQGWVTRLYVEGESLFGEMELRNPELALTSDVSIYVPEEAVDGNGIKYSWPITHIALTTCPVIPGLESFEKLELSKGDIKMDVLKTVSKKLGLSGEKATEANVLLALDALLVPVPNPAKEPAKVTVDDINPAVTKLVSENREIKLSGLVKAGLITPACKDVIVAKYVAPKAVALELSHKQDDGAFDFLYDILAKNDPVSLKEKTGVQSLELANRAVDKPNPIQADVNKRRATAGLTD